MQTKTLLALSFIVISLVPSVLISAISFISLSRLEQNLSNIYFGNVNILSSLSEGQESLLQMRLDVSQYIYSSNEQERQAILVRIDQNESDFLKTLIDYRKIQDFPLQVDILKSRGMSNLTSYENSLLAQVNTDWLAYQQARNNVLSLSNQGLKDQAILYLHSAAADKFSKLVNTYNRIIDLNQNLANIMYDESQSVVKQAVLWAAAATAATTGFAFGTALLISKKLAPSIDEIQKEAKRKIASFISKSNTNSTGFTESATGTTEPSLAGMYGKDEEAGRSSSPSPLPHAQIPSHPSSGGGAAALVGANGENLQDVKLLEKGPMILLHFSQYEKTKEIPFSTSYLQDSSVTSPTTTTTAASAAGSQGSKLILTADSLLDYCLAPDKKESSSSSSSLQKQSSSSQSSSSSASSSTSHPFFSTGSSSSYSNLAGSGNKKNKLVILTKRSSNLYLLGSRTEAEIYILSSTSQDPISTSDDGLLVISIGQTSLILEAIKRTLQENPNSIIILDNITELIHKLGFDKVFSLVQSISDGVSEYSDSRIILLINENAHPQNEVEAIATICNVFIK
jgi:hypothetical protein